MRTHFGVTILALATRTNEGFEPWFDRTTYNRVQALVWRLVPTKQIKNMQLSR